MVSQEELWGAKRRMNPPTLVLFDVDDTLAAAPKVGKAPEPFKAPKGLDFLGLPLGPPG